MSTPLRAEWHRRHFLAAAIPFISLGYTGFVRATPLNTLETLDLPSPNTVIEDASGSQISLADFISMPLLVNFWASWCPPCIHELPALETLDRSLAPHGMSVLLVGADRKGRGFGEDFLADRGISIRQRAYDATGSLARALGIRAMPTSFLVNRNGVLVGKIEGALAWDDAAVIDAVRQRLNTA